MSDQSEPTALPPAVIETLRAALVAPDSDWRAVLDPVLVARADSLVDLCALRTFLLAHADAAGGRIQDRYTLLVLEIERRFQAAAANPMAIHGIAAELFRLKARRAELDEEIALRRDVLELAVGPGNRKDVGGHRVTVSKPSTTLRVVDAASIPEQWQRAQPDRKAILAHYKTTGEVVPGTAMGTGRSSVTVKVIGDGEGGQL